MKNKDSLRKIVQREGFTLAELLIVVAIIAVLVAIAVPVFANQLEKSRESSDFSDARTAYAEVMHAAMGDDDKATFDNVVIKRPNGTFQAEVFPLKQHNEGWATKVAGMEIGGVPSSEWVGSPVKKGACTVSFDPKTEKVTITWGSYGSGGGGFLNLTPQMMSDAIATVENDQGTKSIDSVGYDSESRKPILVGKGDDNPSLGEAKPNTVYHKPNGAYFQTDGKYWYEWDEYYEKWKLCQYPEE